MNRKLQSIATLIAAAAGLTILVNCSSEPNGTTNTLPDGSTETDGGTSDSSTSGGIKTPAEAKAVATAYRDALKAQAARCSAGPFGLVIDTFFDVNQIADVILADGITDAMRSQLQSCISSLGSAPCEGTTPECFTLDGMTGSLANGAACQQDSQCASGACTGSNIKCGECVAATLGSAADCSGDKENLCAPGLVCVNSGASSNCATRTLVQEGGRCGNNAQVCAAGLSCEDAAHDGQSTCRKTVAAGGICADSKGAIATCDKGGSFRCDSTTKSCVALSNEGEACTDTNRCATGLLCDDTSKKCRAAKTNVAVNSACQYGDACVTGASCSGTDLVTGKQVCANLLNEGADCSPGKGLCGAGLSCEQDVCKKNLKPSDCK